eukprot:TRINITY_DN28320_c0_g1_i1.p1 TRINITY_DN28320_c0_g1~~TRINITY_DN28320_c0_g1_i1.p1  ORF type:complete len:517 (-),score=127.07 TRINITY_DN28320_c0_g1_i1:413-1963(-)
MKRAAEPETAKEGGKKAKTEEASGTGIHIFTRDYRLEDHRSLLALSKKCSKIITAFVFTPEQTKESEFFNRHSFEFLLQSLEDLSTRIEEKGGKLQCFFGKHVEVLETVAENVKDLTVVSMTEDYTPYAKQREGAIKAFCEKKGLQFLLTEDHPLCTSVKNIFNGTGGVYKMYTPFYKKCIGADVTQPSLVEKDVNAAVSKLSLTKVESLGKAEHHYSLAEARKALLGEEVPELLWKGNRAACVAMLKGFDFDKYKFNRDKAEHHCTCLGPYLKFGLMSIREVWQHAKKSGAKKDNIDSFVSELYWRDFYMYITYHNPHVLAGMTGGQNGNFNKDLGPVAWKDIESNDGKLALQKWKDGQTGVPLVDAGMREMRRTGYMHNRSRMVVAMFLTKNLLINWRHGEKYFAQHLIDYDPCSNNGGWQWSSSTGADGAPYFRIMNPLSQQQKVDPQANYVSKWVPEVKTVPAKDLHKWDTAKITGKYVGVKGFSYSVPMVDLKKTRELAIAAFKAANLKKL